MRFMKNRKISKMNMISKIKRLIWFGGPSRDPSENFAAKCLMRKGYKIVSRNYDVIFAEIDIVAVKKGIIAFVEVKQRKTSAFGLPCQAVGPEKQRKIRRAAECYLMKNKPDKQPRFDVFEIYGVCDGKEKPKVRHIENAF